MEIYQSKDMAKMSPKKVYEHVIGSEEVYVFLVSTKEEAFKTLLKDPKVKGNQIIPHILAVQEEIAANNKTYQEAIHHESGNFTVAKIIDGALLPKIIEMFGVDTAHPDSGLIEKLEQNLVYLKDAFYQKGVDLTSLDIETGIEDPTFSIDPVIIGFAVNRLFIKSLPKIPGAGTNLDEIMGRWEASTFLWGDPDLDKDLEKVVKILDTYDEELKAQDYNFVYKKNYQHAGSALSFSKLSLDLKEFVYQFTTFTGENFPEAAPLPLAASASYAKQLEHQYEQEIYDKLSVAEKSDLWLAEGNVFEIGISKDTYPDQTKLSESGQILFVREHVPKDKFDKRCSEKMMIDRLGRVKEIKSGERKVRLSRFLKHGKREFLEKKIVRDPRITTLLLNWCELTQDVSIAIEPENVSLEQFVSTFLYGEFKKVYKTGKTPPEIRKDFIAVQSANPIKTEEQETRDLEDNKAWHEEYSDWQSKYFENPDDAFFKDMPSKPKKIRTAPAKAAMYDIYATVINDVDIRDLTIQLMRCLRPDDWIAILCEWAWVKIGIEKVLHYLRNDTKIFEMLMGASEQMEQLGSEISDQMRITDTELKYLDEEETKLAAEWTAHKAKGKAIRDKYDLQKVLYDATMTSNKEPDAQVVHNYEFAAADLSEWESMNAELRDLVAANHVENNIVYLNRSTGAIIGNSYNVSYEDLKKLEENGRKMQQFISELQNPALKKKICRKIISLVGDLWDMMKELEKPEEKKKKRKLPTLPKKPKLKTDDPNAQWRNFITQAILQIIAATLAVAIKMILDYLVEACRRAKEDFAEKLLGSEDDDKQPSPSGRFKDLLAEESQELGAFLDRNGFDDDKILQLLDFLEDIYILLSPSQLCALFNAVNDINAVVPDDVYEDIITLIKIKYPELEPQLGHFSQVETLFELLGQLVPPEQCDFSEIVDPSVLGASIAAGLCDPVLAPKEDYKSTMLGKGYTPEDIDKIIDIKKEKQAQKFADLIPIGIDPSSIFDAFLLNSPENEPCNPLSSDLTQREAAPVPTIKYAQDSVMDQYLNPINQTFRGEIAAFGEDIFSSNKPNLGMMGDLMKSFKLGNVPEKTWEPPPMAFGELRASLQDRENFIHRPISWDTLGKEVKKEVIGSGVIDKDDLGNITLPNIIEDSSAAGDVKTWKNNYDLYFSLDLRDKTVKQKEEKKKQLYIPGYIQQTLPAGSLNLYTLRSVQPHHRDIRIAPIPYWVLNKKPKMSTATAEFPGDFLKAKTKYEEMIDQWSVSVDNYFKSLNDDNIYIKSEFGVTWYMIPPLKTENLPDEYNFIITDTGAQFQSGDDFYHSWIPPEETIENDALPSGPPELGGDIENSPIGVSSTGNDDSEYESPHVENLLKIFNDKWNLKGTSFSEELKEEIRELFDATNVSMLRNFAWITSTSPLFEKPYLKEFLTQLTPPVTAFEGDCDPGKNSSMLKVTALKSFMQETLEKLSCDPDVSFEPGDAPTAFDLSVSQGLIMTLIRTYAIDVAIRLLHVTTQFKLSDMFASDALPEFFALKMIDDLKKLPIQRNAYSKRVHRKRYQNFYITVITEAWNILERRGTAPLKDPLTGEVVKVRVEGNLWRTGINSIKFLLKEQSLSVNDYIEEVLKKMVSANIIQDETLAYGKDLFAYGKDLNEKEPLHLREKELHRQFFHSIKYDDVNPQTRPSWIGGQKVPANMSAKTPAARTWRATSNFPLVISTGDDEFGQLGWTKEKPYFNRFFNTHQPEIAGLGSDYLELGERLKGGGFILEPYIKIKALEGAVQIDGTDPNTGVWKNNFLQGVFANQGNSKSIFYPLGIEEGQINLQQAYANLSSTHFSETLLAWEADTSIPHTNLYEEWKYGYRLTYVFPIEGKSNEKLDVLLSTMDPDSTLAKKYANQIIKAFKTKEYVFPNTTTKAAAAFFDNFGATAHKSLLEKNIYSIPLVEVEVPIQDDYKVPITYFSYTDMFEDFAKREEALFEALIEDTTYKQLFSKAGAFDLYRTLLTTSIYFGSSTLTSELFNNALQQTKLLIRQSYFASLNAFDFSGIEPIEEMSDWWTFLQNLGIVDPFNLARIFSLTPLAILRALADTIDPSWKYFPLTPAGWIAYMFRDWDVTYFDDDRNGSRKEPPLCLDEETEEFGPPIPPELAEKIKAKAFILAEIFKSSTKLADKEPKELLLYAQTAPELIDALIVSYINQDLADEKIEELADLFLRYIELSILKEKFLKSPVPNYTDPAGFSDMQGAEWVRTQLFNEVKTTLNVWTDEYSGGYDVEILEDFDQSDAQNFYWSLQVLNDNTDVSPDTYPVHLNEYKIPFFLLDKYKGMTAKVLMAAHEKYVDFGKSGNPYQPYGWPLSSNFIENKPKPSDLGEVYTRGQLSKFANMWKSIENQKIKFNATKKESDNLKELFEQEGIVF